MARRDESTIALIILINGLVLAGVILYVGFVKERYLQAILLGVPVAVAAVLLSRLWYRVRERFRAGRRT